MRQVWIPRIGGPEVLEVRETATPEPGAGQVRIRVRAAGVNFADALARMGLYPDAPKLPTVVGYEVSGAMMREIVDLCAAGTLAPVVDRAFPSPKRARRTRTSRSAGTSARWCWCPAPRRPGCTGPRTARGAPRRRPGRVVAARRKP